MVVALAALCVIGWQAWLATPQAHNEPLTGVWDLGWACDERDRAREADEVARTYFPTADAYSGAAPHPIAFFRIEDGAIGSVEQVEPDGAYGPYAVDEPERIQLIACLGESAGGGLIDYCEFDGGKEIGLYRGEYHAVLYETRTGRRIAEAHVVGSEDMTDCPSFFMYTKGHAAPNTEPDVEALEAAFGSHVKATR